MSSYPKLKPGLVIRYEYLWRRQALQGQTVGEKERPSCVVVAVEGRMVVLPITHSPPHDENQAIEVPHAVNKHLGLDNEISYVNVAECNLDLYPSPDMKKVPHSDDFHYGLMPRKFLIQIRNAVLHNIQIKNFMATDREDEDMTQEGDLSPFLNRK